VVHKPDEKIYLPSELCQIPNLPDDFTKDKNAMRDLQQFKSFDPTTRINRIQEMGAKLKDCKSVKEANIEISDQMV